MAFQNQTDLDVVYDNKIYGNVIDPLQWNDNFKEIEEILNANRVKIDANFDVLDANTGSAAVGSPALTDLSQTLDSNVYEQLVLIASGLANRYEKTVVDGKVNTCIKSVSLNATNGVLTFIKYDDTTFTIDTVLEKVPVSMSIVDVTGTPYLRVVNQDGSYTQTDVSTLFNSYTFTDSGTIDFTVNGYGVTAVVKNGSITETMLHSDLMTALQGYASSASADALSASGSKTAAETAETNAETAQGLAVSAKDSAVTAKTAAELAETNAETAANTATSKATLSESYAVGGTASRSGEDTDNAKYYCQLAQSIAEADKTETAIAGVTETAVADGDTIPFTDTSSSNAMKKISWSNIKATLKTYFDTLYSASGHTHTSDSTKADKRTSQVLQTTDYTFALTDEATVQKCLSASAMAATINTNANVTFPVNAELVILQYGAGIVTVTPTSGVTLNGGTAGIPLTGQYKAATLKQIATDEWLLIGSI